MEQESYEESFSAIKDRMLKTSEIIEMVRNTCRKYHKIVEIYKKMKQELSENTLKMHRFTLENNRLNVLLEDAKLSNEKLQAENKSLSADKLALGEQYDNYLVKSQITIRDLESKLEASTTTTPVSKPGKKKIDKSKGASRKVIKALEKQVQSLNKSLQRETEKTESITNRYELLTERLKISAQVSKTKNVSGSCVYHIGVQTEDDKENVESPNVIEIGVQTENSENCDNCFVKNILEEFKSYPSLLSPMSDDDGVVDDLNVVSADNSDHNYIDNSNFYSDSLLSPSKNQDLEEVVSVLKRSTKTQKVASRRNGLFEMKYMRLKNRLKMFTRNLHLKYQRSILDSLTGLQKYRINYLKKTKGRKKGTRTISSSQNLNTTTSYFERPQNIISGNSSQDPLHDVSNLHPITNSENKMPWEINEGVLKQHNSPETVLNFSSLFRSVSNPSVLGSSVASNNTPINYEEEAFLNRLVDLVSQRLRNEEFQKKDPGNTICDISEPLLESNEGSKRDPTLLSATVATDTYTDPCNSNHNKTSDSRTDFVESADNQNKSQLEVILKETTTKNMEIQCSLIKEPLPDNHNEMNIDDIDLKLRADLNNIHRTNSELSASGNPALYLDENPKLDFSKPKVDIQAKEKTMDNSNDTPNKELKIKILDITVIIPINSTSNKSDGQLCINSERNYVIANNICKLLKHIPHQQYSFPVIQVLNFCIGHVEMRLFIRNKEVKPIFELRVKLQSAPQKQITDYNKYHKKSITTENMKTFLDYINKYVEGIPAFLATLTENSLPNNNKKLPENTLKRPCSDSEDISCMNMSKKIKLEFDESEAIIRASVLGEKKSDYEQDKNPILQDDVKPFNLVENVETIEPSLPILDILDSQSAVNIDRLHGKRLIFEKSLNNLAEDANETKDDGSSCHGSLQTVQTDQCNLEFDSVPNLNENPQLIIQIDDDSSDKDVNNDGGELLASEKSPNNYLSDSTRKLPQMIPQYQCSLTSKPKLTSPKLKANFESHEQTQDDYEYYKESVIMTAEYTDSKEMNELDNGEKHVGELSIFETSPRCNKLPNISEKLPERIAKRKCSSSPVSEGSGFYPKFASGKNLIKKLKSELAESQEIIQISMSGEEANYKHDEKLDSKIAEDVELFSSTNGESQGQPLAFNTFEEDSSLLNMNLSFLSTEDELDAEDLLELDNSDEEYLIPYPEIDLPLLSPMSPDFVDDTEENCSDASVEIIPNKNEEMINIDESTSILKCKSSPKHIQAKIFPKTHLQRNLSQVVELKKRMLFPLSQNMCKKSNNGQNAKISPKKRLVIKKSVQNKNSTSTSNLHSQRNEKNNVIEQQNVSLHNSHAISERHIQDSNSLLTPLNVCNKIKKRKIAKKIASTANLPEIKTSEKNAELVLMNNGEGATENLDVLSKIISEMDRDKPKLLKPTRENRSCMWIDDSTYKRQMLDLMAVLREKADVTQDLHPNWYEEQVKTRKKWFIDPLPRCKSRLLGKLLKADTPSIQDDVVIEFGHLAVGDVIEMMLHELLINRKNQLATSSQSQVLTPVQDRFLNLMIQLEKKFGSNVGQAFLEKVETEMWNRECCVKAAVSISRLYTAVCRLRGEVVRIRNYFCTAFLRTSISYIPLMYAVLTTWPDVFPKEPEWENFAPSKVIVYSIHQQKSENSIRVSLQGLKSLLTTYYQYNNVDNWDGEKMCDDLFRDYYNQPTISKEYALQVFFKNQAPKFLSRKLEQVLKPFVYKISNPEHLSNIILLMGKLCKISKNCLTPRQISELCLWLLRYITDTTPQIVKMSIQLCVEVLLKR